MTNVRYRGGPKDGQVVPLLGGSARAIVTQRVPSEQPGWFHVEEVEYRLWMFADDRGQRAYEYVIDGATLEVPFHPIAIATHAPYSNEGCVRLVYPPPARWPEAQRGPYVLLRQDDDFVYCYLPEACR